MDFVTLHDFENCSDIFEIEKQLMQQTAKNC